jgi:hypothetical protein
MGMHPMIHLTMLIGSSVLVTTNHDNFYEVVNGQKCPPKSEGAAFVNGAKYSLMNLVMLGHGVALALHWLSQILNHYEVKVFANILAVVKMVLFFIMILKVQSSIDFTECAKETNRSQVMAWLTFEVLMFYLNLVSLSMFIFI